MARKWKVPGRLEHTGKERGVGHEITEVAGSDQGGFVGREKRLWFTEMVLRSCRDLSPGGHLI